jgi:hypothetical protein
VIVRPGVCLPRAGEKGKLNLRSSLVIGFRGGRLSQKLGQRQSIVMIHVVLDTNVFTGDPKRNGGPFRALVRLCKGDKARLHLPYMVKMEFVTQQVQAARKALKEMRKVADDLYGIMRDCEITDYAQTIKERATELRNEARALIETEWSGWLKEMCAVEYPIDPTHGSRVVSDYFSGRIPFKAAKNRNDLPDSFVWHTIVDIAKQYRPLHIVSADWGMCAAASSLEGIVVHDKLAAFIDTGDCRKALEELGEQAVAKNAERAGAILRSVLERLEFAVASDILVSLDGKTVSDDSIPDDNNEGMIYLINSPSEINFAFDKVEYYGGGELGIPFDATTECTINYAIFKADYYCLDEEKMNQISIEDRNNHYFDADENYDIKAAGTLQIKLNEENLRNDAIGNDDLRDLLNEADYTLVVGDISVA